MLNKFRGEIHGSEGNVFISPSGVSRKKAENVMGLWLLWHWLPDFRLWL